MAYGLNLPIVCVRLVWSHWNAAMVIHLAVSVLGQQALSMLDQQGSVVE